jgi:hypothetical protein
MKNLFSFLVLSAVFISCSKDADDTDSGLQDFTVILYVDPDYRISEFTQSIHAFLSDQNGNILDSGELQLGQSLTLNFTGEPTALYDLSYVYYANIDIVGEELYTLITFSDIDSGEYFIGPSQTIENTNDEIYLNLNNTGYPCEMTSNNAGAGTFGPENGGYYIFRGNLRGSPSSDFYVSFKSPNDQYDRFFWREDVTEGSEYNIEYSTLPEIQNIVDVQIPANDRSGFNLEGLISNDTNHIAHSIRRGNFINGNASLSIPVPSNIFDGYLFRLSFGDDNFQYSKNMHTATIPNVVEIPALSFTVNNQSPQHFNMTTNGSAIIYDVIFRGANANETVFVAHQIYGEVLPEVSFSKETLRMNIQQTYPHLTGFETLPLGTVSLTHYSEINSYKDILQYKIQGKVYEIQEGGFYEGVYKQFD